MQFNPLSYRDDVGQLFENFIFMERLKYNEYKKTFANMHYWRNFDQKEIDIIEVKDVNINAFEIKYGTNKKYKVPNDFVKNYPNSSFNVINCENYLEYLL